MYWNWARLCQNLKLTDEVQHSLMNCWWLEVSEWLPHDWWVIQVIVLSNLKLWSLDFNDFGVLDWLDWTYGASTWILTIYIPVIIVSQRDVLSGVAKVQECLNMFEEPGFVPVTNVVESSGVTRVHHLPGHHHCSVPGEHETLNKVRSISSLHLLLECLDHLVETVDWVIVQLDEALAGNNGNLNWDKEAKSSVAPGHGVEEVRVFIRRTSHKTSICQHQLKTDEIIYFSIFYDVLILTSCRCAGTDHIYDCWSQSLFPWPVLQQWDHPAQELKKV